MFGKGEQEELLRELTSLRQRIAELEADRARGLRLDGVTGMLSMRPFGNRLVAEVHDARHHHRPLSLAVIAIDDFSALELKHGFRATDELLQAFARRLSSRSESHELRGRIGTAEFGLILPGAAADEAVPRLERLLLELELLGEGPVRAVSVSMGVALLEPGMTPEALMSNARVACERAQRDGGGRAIVDDSASQQLIETVIPPQRDAVEALAIALLERDRYTGEHSEAVIGIAVAVARNLGCNPAEIESIKSAALLHDIGKVAIPDDILRKPGPLSDQEWKLMKEHPTIGERILRVLPGLGPVARIVRHEHERWDGEGYPDGLAREQIPIGSRIIIAADTYHAITSDRPYRSARSHREAIEELARCAGSQFDPQVTAALIGHLYGRRQAGLVASER